MKEKRMVFHWTTKENSEKILREGLRPYSFFARKMGDWNGEICLLFEIDIDWDNRDADATWQGITKTVIPREKIFICTDEAELERYKKELLGEEE